MSKHKCEYCDEPAVVLCDDDIWRCRTCCWTDEFDPITGEDVENIEDDEEAYYED